MVNLAYTPLDPLRVAYVWYDNNLSRQDLGAFPGAVLAWKK